MAMNLSLFNRKCVLQFLCILIIFLNSLLFPVYAIAELIGDPFSLNHENEKQTTNQNNLIKQDGCSDGTVLAGDPFAESKNTDNKLKDSYLTDEQKKSYPWSISGFIESRDQLALKHMHQPVSLRQRIQLEVKKQFEHISFFASGRTDYDFASHTWSHQYHNPFLISLHETYLTFDSEYFDFFIGRKIHRWGASDGINPMDLINPIDTSDPFSSGRADNRIPSTMILVKWIFNNLSLEGVFLPLSPVSDLQSRGNPWNGSDLDSIFELEELGKISTHNKKPNRIFEQVGYGGKLSAFLFGWDLSFMYFSGNISNAVWFPKFNKLKYIKEFNARYPRFQAYGFSFAKAFGSSSTFRGELSYKPQYYMNMINDLYPYRGNYLQSVLGIDYDFDSKYYMNLQIFTDYFRGSSKIDKKKSKYWNGLSYEMSGKWLNDDLKCGIRGKIYTSNGDGSITDIFAEYKFNDSFEIDGGVMFWLGKEKGMMGMYDKNDMIYIKLKYSF